MLRNSNLSQRPVVSMLWPGGLVKMENVDKQISLAGTSGHFISFATRGGGGGTIPRAVSPMIESEFREKNERVAGRKWRKTKRLVYELKDLGQPVTSESEVSSSAEKWRKPVIADNISDGL